MKRVICIVVLLCSASFASTQKPQLPRNPERLIARAQEFWAAVIASQRLKASEFVLPEKKELFLAGNSMPVVAARVVGVDLTDNLDRAVLRVELNVFMKEVQPGQAKWSITDVWLWRRNNWYLDLADAREVMKGALSTSIAVEDIKKRIEKSLTLVEDIIDLGTIIQGQHLRREIPIRYEGDVPLTVESLIATELMSAQNPGPEGITSRSKHFILLMTPDNWSGPFSIPLPVRFRREAAVVEKVLTVKGDVFVPIAFRQDPPLVPIRGGQLVSVFLRNNGTEPARIRYVTVDGKLDILIQPTVAEPNRETEVALRLKPDEIPGRLEVVLDGPFYGRSSYEYLFKLER